MLLNLSIFMWYGIVCPWASFANNNVIPIYRLIILGILILLLRRMPIVFAMHWKIKQIEEKRQALFVGFFGPIGVSAVFYLYVSLEFLRDITTANGEVRPDAARLVEVMRVVIWFLAICSIVVHGLSVPLGKVGYHIPRTLSSAMASQDREEPESFRLREAFQHNAIELRQRRRGPDEEPQRPIFRVGGSYLRTGAVATNESSGVNTPARAGDSPATPSEGPSNGQRLQGILMESSDSANRGTSGGIPSKLK
jgi:hypothetical protein